MNGFELEFADEKIYTKYFFDNDNGRNVTSTANYFQYCHPAEPQTSQEDHFPAGS